MNTSKKTIGIIAIAALIVGAVFIMTKPAAKESSYSYTDSTPTTPTSGPSTATPTTTTTTPKTTTPVSTVKSYSASEVAAHNSSSSCWTIVNGNVYDVTRWISQHPGGQGAIKGMCGVDASSEFNDQHGGDGGPERILAGFKIGIFK